VKKYLMFGVEYKTKMKGINMKKSGGGKGYV